MFGLNKVVTHLSNIFRGLFKFTGSFVNNLKSSMVDLLSEVKRIPFDIINSSCVRTIIGFLERCKIIDSHMTKDVYISED